MEQSTARTGSQSGRGQATRWCLHLLMSALLGLLLSHQYEGMALRAVFLSVPLLTMIVSLVRHDPIRRARSGEMASFPVHTLSEALSA